ncbi:hypothetical protein IWX90DRAFT_507294 [Phyllosticta citrichinensis]|uniref:Uncharacterized protein n=1 Tax=Phyllosticta citrichinensis TaxID=1130410 RepID=A0ABR1XK69_9PEZI
MRTRLQFFALSAVLGHLVWLFGGVSAAPMAASASKSGNFVGNLSQHGKHSGSSLPQIETTQEKPLDPEQTVAHTLDSRIFVHGRSHLGKDRTYSPSPIQNTREQHVSKHVKREAAKKVEKGSKNDKEREKQQEEEEKRFEAALPDTDHKVLTPDQTELLTTLQKHFIGNLTETDEQFISALPPHQQKATVDRIVELRLSKALAWLTDEEKNAILIEIPDGIEESLFLQKFPMFANNSGDISLSRKLSPGALQFRNAVRNMVADDTYFLKHKGSQGRHPRMPGDKELPTVIDCSFCTT